MTEMNDPVRLKLGGSPETRAILGSAPSNLPTQLQLDRLASRLAPTVTAPPAASSSLIIKIGVGIAIVAAVAAVWWPRDRAPSRPEPSPPAAPIVTATRAAPTTEAAAPPPAPPARVVEEAPKRDRARAPAKATTDPVETPAVDSAPQPREMDLLRPAHEALGRGDLQRALELATSHARLYEKGVMVEEREAIAIEALHRLGRDEARARFDEFVVRFPRSGYRARLERLVAESKR